MIAEIEFRSRKSNLPGPKETQKKDSNAEFESSKTTPDKHILGAISTIETIGEAQKEEMERR